MSIWIKINTGMHRLGFPDSYAKTAYEALSTLPTVNIQGLMTHFAKADELDCPDTAVQIRKFNEATKDLIGDRSLANSAGILGWKEAHADWIRPGIMLYGVTPLSGRTGRDEGLEPVMTLCSEIISIQNPKKVRRLVIVEPMFVQKICGLASLPLAMAMDILDWHLMERLSLFIIKLCLCLVESRWI